jgi:predicted Zn-dependent protease
LVFIDNPNAYAIPAKCGGAILINTGVLFECKTIDDVAGILAHELGHVVARHLAEKRTSQWLASFVVRAFGFKGDLGHDLVTFRMLEAEADHMGLLYMAQAGFDPQKRVDSTAQDLKEELVRLNGAKPMPEFLLKHPSVSELLLISHVLKRS